MKHLFLFLLISISGFAQAEEIECSRPGSDKITYHLSSNDLLNYKLTVTRTLVDPLSCRTRWGCDETKEVIYRDVMKGTDYQGALVLESKKTYMNLEDMDDVTYTYTKLTNGRFITLTESLKCEVI